MRPLHFILPAALTTSVLAGGYDPGVLPKGHEYFELREGLANCRVRFEREKAGRIAFLGGSITAMPGWRDKVIAWFKARYPETAFDFISAGIPSMGSVPHSFRLERDVLSRGPVDLLFVEAAVNDSTNESRPESMLRGMEGVIRHARTANPLTDIVQMHFVMPEHMTDYQNGRVPVSIARHESVAAAYGSVTLNLSREVTDRIAAGQFSWAGEFKDLHPSPFGQQLYANSIIRTLEAGFGGAVAAAAKPHAMPDKPLDPHSYFRGRLAPVSEARPGKGFTLEPAWKPADGKGTRDGFVNVPALTSTTPGSEFSFTFEGTAAGLFIAAGPDAGHIAFSIDGSPFRETDTFTAWSAGLHLPWALILDDTLQPGIHKVTVRLEATHHPKATGTALRVFHLLLN